MRFRILMIAALVTALGLPAGLRGQPKTPDKEPEKSFIPKIEGAMVPDDKKDEVKTAPTKKKRKPRISAEDLYRVRPSQSEAKLQHAINTLYSIIDYEDDEQKKPQLLARLAKLYWEKAEGYFMKAYAPEMDKEIREAYDSKDEKAVLEAEAKRERLIKMQTEWRQKAIKIFVEIEAKFPNYEKLDMVLFYLGNFLTQMGEDERGYKYYEKLIMRFPDSDYLADTLVNIGDFYFDKNEYMTAQQFYAKVKSFKGSNIYGYALYKEAWCHYNMAEYNEAFQGFVAVINYSLEMKKKGKRVRIGLMQEAQKDLVLAYSQVGKESQAIDFFKDIAPDIYMTLAAQLAGLYLDQGEPKKGIKLYKSLIKETVSKDPEDPKILSFQRAIVQASDKTADKLVTRKEVTRLVDLFTVFRDKKADVIDKESPKIEKVLLQMAIAYHLEAQKIGERKTMLLSQEVYHHYLNLFPEASGRYQMTMNLAILNYQLEDWQKAVERYEQVIAMDPKGKHSREAAYTSLLCYYKLIDTKGGSVKAEDQDLDGYKPVELPGLEANMVRACDRYIGMKPDDPEEIVQAKFAAARIYYDYNHFKKAAERFKDIIKNNPEHELAPDSAKMLLSSFTMTRDIKSLNLWADKLHAIPSLAKGDLLVIINKIRNQAKFNRCFEYEFEKRYELAAECFILYAQDFSDSKLVDKAYYNAALNYRRANKFLLALQANAGLYSCCAKSSPLGPRALYLIADTFRMAGVYEQAAINFEKYVKSHPRAPKNKKALLLAAKFRRSLGQYQEAIKDSNLYIKRYRKDDKVPAVYFEIGLLYKRQKNYRKALSHFNAYLKKYRNRGGVNLLLAAYQEIGELYLKMRKIKLGKKQFQVVIDTFKGLSKDEKSKISVRGLSAIAWAFFNLGDETANEAARVKLTRRKLKDDVTKKGELIAKAEMYYRTVLALQHPYWSTGALYRIGAAWERFAKDLENSPLPPGLSIDEKEEYKLKLSDSAEGFRKKAIAAYKKCLEEAVARRVFNEFTEKAEVSLSVLEFQFSGMKEYRVRPGFYALRSNHPGFMRPPQKLESKRSEEEEVPSSLPNPDEPATEKPPATDKPATEKKPATETPEKSS